MCLKAVTNLASIDEIVGIIRADGGVVIKGYMDPQALCEFREELLPHLASTPSGDDAFFAGLETKRCSRLLSRTKRMQDVALNPLYLETARKILQVPHRGYIGEELVESVPDIQLGVTQAIQIAPGQTVQPLHRDDGVWQWKHPTNGREARLQIMLAITPFTKANGATNVIPGSHLWGDDQKPTLDQSVSAEMDAGDALIWVGSLFHGGGANTSDGVRIGVTMGYDLAYLRQEENHYLSLTKKEVKAFPEELQKLVGWEMSSTYVGFVEIDGKMSSPLKLLRDSDDS